MITVESKVEVIEVDLRAVPKNTNLTIPVRTHLNEPNYVVLEVGGKKFTVNGFDLMKAVRNVVEPRQ